MKRIFAIFICLVLLCAGALADERVLIVSGEGSVAMDADWASVTVGVELSGEDLTSLQQQVNESMEAICNALTAAGLEEKNISTSQFYVSPVYGSGGVSSLIRGYDGSSSEIVGYTITNSLSIQTGEIDRIGAYIDTAFAAGANSFNSIQFSLQDESTARQLALERAVADARSKAEIIASASGEELGEVLEIVESDVSSYARSNSKTMWSYESADSASGATVRASQVVVSANIQITYQLK